MKTRVDEVLKEVAADLAQHCFDAHLLNRSVARMKALRIETEDDRHEYLSGYLRFVDYLVAHAPAEVVDTLDGQRRAVQAHFDRLYGRPDTPYLSTNRIVQSLVHGLWGGGSCDELVVRALAELEEIAFDGSPEDAVVKMGGILRIRAVETTHNSFAQSEEMAATSSPLAALAAQFNLTASRDRLDIGIILSMAEKIQAPPAASPEFRQAIARLLMIWLGTGLLFRPEAAPALEPLRDRIMALLSDEAPPPETVASRCDAILDGLATTLERDGFSEYAYREATAAIQELPTQSAEDNEAVLAAHLRMFDITATYAPAEIAKTLLAARSGAERIGQALNSDEAPLTAEVMRSRCDAITHELKAELQAGGELGPTIMKAQMALQELAMLFHDSGGEATKIVLQTMLEELPHAILPYVPENAQLQFRESMATMALGFQGFDIIDSSDEPVGWAMYDQLVNEQVGRLVGSADPQSMSAEFAHVSHIRQFVDLLPSFYERLRHSRLGIDEKTNDGTEIKRLATRFEQYATVIGAAYTEEQFLRHQRGALRRVALELRQFEWRHHLMAAQPPFPTNAVTVDPNAVFFSGSEQVKALLEQACQTLGMGLATKHGVDNPTRGRWQQLRQSGVAVFDYSAYDPRRADPAGPVPRSREAEADMLRAAGPVARVAYETGWAYVTGTPMIIVAQQGETIPFDIDIEAVLLQGDGHDAERLVAALQAALYGVPPGIRGNCLEATVAELRRHHGEHVDPQVQALLGSVSDVHDATQVRRALRAVLDRVEGEKSLLVLPAFPGSYPPEGRRRLFHVAAFRDWGKAAQAETRSACERAGVDYQIGYECLNPDVMRMIWSDLCEASFVVVDITNLNPNAVLELAIAQALGRRTLILTQNVEPHAHLPAIQKVRTHG